MLKCECVKLFMLICVCYNVEQYKDYMAMNGL